MTLIGMKMAENKYWSQYWAQGHQTSFGASFPTGYEGVIKTNWQNVFKKVTENTNVLDLCTGNASLIRLAEEAMSDFSHSNFTGVDYAKVNIKDDFEKLRNVKLIFDTNVESLPLTSCSYDLIISNFGVEYSHLTKSIVEVSRLLKPAGKVEFICHYEQSIIVIANNKELAMLNTMLSTDNAIDCLDKLIRCLPDKDGAETWRNDLNSRLSEINILYFNELQQSEFLKFLKFVLNPNVRDKLKQFDFFKEEILGHQTRLNTLSQAALSEDKLDKIFGCFIENGLVLTEHNKITNNEGIVAYRLSATKSD